jgi:hypothetical protein
MIQNKLDLLIANPIEARNFTPGEIRTMFEGYVIRNAECKTAFAEHPVQGVMDDLNRSGLNGVKLARLQVLINYAYPSGPGSMRALVRASLADVLAPKSPKTELQILDEDRRLDGHALDDKYNEDGDGEHPVYGRAKWRFDVVERNTISGYWDWVQFQITHHYESLEG